MNERLKKFLDRICVEYGICLPIGEKFRICNEEVLEKEQVLTEIFMIEGLNPIVHLDLFKKVKCEYEKMFGE